MNFLKTILNKFSKPKVEEPVETKGIYPRLISEECPLLIGKTLYIPEPVKKVYNRDSKGRFAKKN